MKFSIIMQVYLGKYPGSRSNPVKKFTRAVQSFIDQTYSNSELIIISDGCQIVHDIYHKYYKDNTRIKYAYLDKDEIQMDVSSKIYPYGAIIFNEITFILSLKFRIFVSIIFLDSR